MPTFDFDTAFEALTGNSPFPWQRRLFKEWLVVDKLPAAVDIPTGLGKTSVMALWLLARAAGAKQPRRLVYVVDRRAVVDQATHIAQNIRCKLESCKILKPVKQGLGLRDGDLLPISTLRGQHADNWEWLEDPAASAIIVGTVDMIGSRLLFSGYGVSRKMRPNHAGLLGADTLVMLDEAHLVPPFEELLKTIVQETSGSDTGTLGPSCTNDRRDIIPPFKMLPLSATRRSNEANEQVNVFRHSRDDLKNDTVRMRLEATKTLIIQDLAENAKLESALAEAAWNLALEKFDADNSLNRILIYCNYRKDAETVANDLQSRIKKAQSKFATILFVGGRRVYEREEAEQELKQYGFISGTFPIETPQQTRKIGKTTGCDEMHAVTPSSPTAVFLVATSAGEVGIDLDADHMICDLVAWERMVQRLGRVNRRGMGEAHVLVIDQATSTHGADTSTPCLAHAGTPCLTDTGLPCLKAVRHLLERLPQVSEGRYQAGPAALADIGSTLELHNYIQCASTPAPFYPALSRPLVDAWAMTSLPEYHAGVPEVGPWLRGWVDDEPQISVVWRRYLPWWDGTEARGMYWDHATYRQRRNELDNFFDSAPPQTLEILETSCSRVVDWLIKRSKRIQKNFDSLPKISTTAKTEDDERIDELAACSPIPKLTPSSAVVFPIHSDGSTNVPLCLGEITKIHKSELMKRTGQSMLIVDARLGGIKSGLLDASIDDIASTRDDKWGTRSISEEHQPDIQVSVICEETRSNRQEKPEIQEIFAMHHPKSPDKTPRAWLVVEKRQNSPSSSEDSGGMAPRFQKLSEHQAAVAQEVERIGLQLGLSDHDRETLIIAACNHDEGKRTRRWQNAFSAPSEDGPYAKTPGPFNRHALNGYRHEFQSVLDMQKENLPGIERSSKQLELALHLIAAHHGRARPSIDTVGCDELPPSMADHEAYIIALRFARLQKEWGPWGLAWWEALLRAADRNASRKLDSNRTKQ